jgi:putative RNA 2'-phosphotransferase
MKQLSKAISYYLRHAPHELGLQLQPGGWVEVADFLAGLQARGYVCSPDDLAQLVAASDKQRFSLEGQRIRANQGHSVAVDLQLLPESPPALLYHGTTARFLASILAQGLQRGKRHHVHLSQDPDTARQVGRRHGPLILLEVDAATMSEQGLIFYRSANHVWLTDWVPPGCLREL